MMTEPARFTLVPKAIEALTDRPGGMRLRDLAGLLGVSRDALLAEFDAYHASVGDVLRGGYREPALEFVPDPAGPNADSEPAVTGFVRLRDLRPAAEAKVRAMSLGELGEVIRLVRERMLAEPDNSVLAEVLDALTGSGPTGEESSAVERARPFRRAAAERQRMRISYAPEWRSVLIERVIEPYQVVHTRRGWEIDAGVVGKEGVVGTFLVAGVRSFDVLADTFEPPPDLAARIDRARRPRSVELVVPHAATWAVEMHAESAEVLEEDEDEIRPRALLLPPVAARLGLLLLAAGPAASVLAPPAAADAGRAMARDLLRHHSTAPDR